MSENDLGTDAEGNTLRPESLMMSYGYRPNLSRRKQPDYVQEFADTLGQAIIEVCDGG